MGKPRMCRGDAIAKDAQILLNVGSSRRAAEDRDGWKRRIEEARVRFEL